MNLGENIYLLRTKKNLSQGDLAQNLEVSRQSVSKWENNSAVPELEKLMKMAQIFDVTIDELVRGEKYTSTENPVPEKTVAEQPKIIYVRETAPSLRAAQILGIIILAIAVLIFALHVCFDRMQELEEIAVLFIPVVVCGILCIAVKQPLLWCTWVGCFGYWLYIFILSAKWENEIFLLVLGAILVFCALYYTYTQHKKGNIHMEPWIWGVILLLLLGCTVLLAINLIPPSDVYVTYPSESITQIYPG